MKRKVFLTILLACLVVSFWGCAPATKTNESFKYDDLVVVDTSTIGLHVGFGGTSAGVYVFFFEEHQSRIAFNNQVSIKFDGSLERPVVEGTLSLKNSNILYEGKIFGVVITFKDREQMKEYWPGYRTNSSKQ